MSYENGTGPKPTTSTVSYAINGNTAVITLTLT